jgi:hypothetical protein
LSSVLFVIEIGIGKIKQWDGDHREDDDDDDNAIVLDGHHHRHHSVNSALASFYQLKDQFRNSASENNFFSEFFRQCQLTSHDLNNFRRRIFSRRTIRVTPFHDFPPQSSDARR